jgi:hypothetical protein
LTTRSKNKETKQKYRNYLLGTCVETRKKKTAFHPILS